MTVIVPIPSYYSEIIPNLFPPIPNLTTHSHPHFLDICILISSHSQQ